MFAHVCSFGGDRFSRNYNLFLLKLLTTGPSQINVRADSKLKIAVGLYTTAVTEGGIATELLFQNLSVKIAKDSGGRYLWLV